jgi:hypothetical protein
MFKREDVEGLIKELIEKNKNYSNKIEFTDYCRTKMEERGVEEGIVIKNLLSGIPYYAEEQAVKGEKRHKLIYKISSRYSLIIITACKENVLKVINVIKTSKSAEKLWRKKISE